MLKSTAIAMILEPVAAKFIAAATGLGGLLIAQDAINQSPVPQWLDLGVTMSGLALLAYMLRLVISGDLISKTLTEEVSKGAVTQALDQIDLKRTVEEIAEDAITRTLSKIAIEKAATGEPKE